MFDNDKEYLKATRHAQVNTYAMNRKNSFLLLIWNTLLFLSFAVLAYLGYSYIKDEGVFSKNTTVMGVSHTKSDNEYIEMLSQIDVDDVSGINKNVSLNEAMESVVNSSTSRDNSLYTQAISSEIDDKYHQNSVVILVKQGDTLASISEKFYGDETAFEKIIEANENLNKDSKVIYVGQKLNIPY